MTPTPIPSVVGGLKPCPFCSDPMQIKHGTLKHEEEAALEAQADQQELGNRTEAECGELWSRLRNSWDEDECPSWQQVEPIVQGIFDLAPLARRPTYERIIELVEDCRVRMDRAGESTRMMAKWISEGLNALCAPSPMDGRAASTILGDNVILELKAAQHVLGYPSALGDAIEAIAGIDQERVRLWNEVRELRSLLVVEKAATDTMRAERDECRKALEPLARLKVPTVKNGGNAGAYSILFSDIRSALTAALQAQPSKGE